MRDIVFFIGDGALIHRQFPLWRTESPRYFYFDRQRPGVGDLDLPGPDLVPTGYVVVAVKDVVLCPSLHQGRLDLDQSGRTEVQLDLFAHGDILGLRSSGIRQMPFGIRTTIDANRAVRDRCLAQFMLGVVGEGNEPNRIAPPPLLVVFVQACDRNVIGLKGQQPLAPRIRDRLGPEKPVQ